MQSISEFEEKKNFHEFPMFSTLVFLSFTSIRFYSFYPYQVTVGSAWRMASESPQRTSPWKFHARKSTYVATCRARSGMGRSTMC